MSFHCMNQLLRYSNDHQLVVPLVRLPVKVTLVSVGGEGSACQCFHFELTLWWHVHVNMQDMVRDE